MKMQSLCTLMIVLVALFLNNQANGERQDPCVQAKQIGPCKAAIPRYYFDKTFGKCQLFYYGGCQGNENNFETLSSCQRQCGCKLPKDSGFCLAYFRRFYFNSKSLQCEQFIYGGCGSNENNFKTLADCHMICENTKYKDQV
ncbi:hypothetical protein ACJMK2_006413 [Sinanodonta woodiana]|uniref:BPTI/Kunitz inhibitor domain-containing protein n=1 Tax=Sinanodonta woodiana TaxID=1069815 RepID=A0ABD3VW99_SINWO